MPQTIDLIHIEDRRIFSPEAGLSRQVLAYSDKLMLIRHFMEKGWIGARHSHAHEQLVYIISGHIRFTGAGRMFDARTGDSFIVPGAIEHEASALEPSEVLDIFTPYREDYAAAK
jgi:quercetin dioxygenase-like cupin family protein